MSVNHEFKKIIDRIKFEFSINQTQIAERMKVKSTYLSDMINGRVPFNESFKNKIYEEFHIDLPEKSSYENKGENSTSSSFISIIENQQRTIEIQQRTIETLSKTIENLSSK